MRTHKTSTGVKRFNIDAELKSAVGQCIEFIDSNQWIGRHNRTAADVHRLEHDLHRTLARSLGHELKQHIDRLLDSCIDLDSHYSPYQARDHGIDRAKLPELCKEVQDTQIVLMEAKALIRRMIDHNLYPELPLDDQLEYIDRLWRTLETTHATLDCCQESYEPNPTGPLHLPHPRLPHPRLPHRHFTQAERHQPGEQAH